MIVETRDREIERRAAVERLFTFLGLFSGRARREGTSLISYA